MICEEGSCAADGMKDGIGMAGKAGAADRTRREGKRTGLSACCLDLALRLNPLPHMLRLRP
eukprot:1278446-Pleurochrysis_carterae.AAC.1